MRGWMARSREACWKLFNEAYPGYVSEDTRYEELVREAATQDAVVMDAGCGWQMPFSRRLVPHVRRVVGVDEGIDSGIQVPGLEGVVASLEALPFEANTFDIIMSRSVFEHLTEPERVFSEFSRVLKPGGRLVFLTPNAWDYVSIVSRLIPNRLHGKLMKRVLEREERDTFPVYYRANTEAALRKLCEDAGLELTKVELRSQYPAYLMFSPLAFRGGIAYDKWITRHDALAFLRSWVLGVATRR